MGATAVYQIFADDFNNDGIVDIYTPSLSARLLINLRATHPAYGGRVFRETYVGWNAGGFYGSARGAYGDLDRNGLLDDFVAVNQDGLKLLKDGSFPAEFPGAEAIPLGHGRVFGAASLADMNNDGNLDVVLASERNEFTDDYRLLGRDCMVEIWASRHTGNPPYSLADMNWDRVPLVESTIIDKTRAPIENGLPGYPQTAMAIADFDGDGDMDVMRSSRFAPLVLFQNVWNTQRYVRIETTVTRGNISQTTNSFISVRGSTSTVVPLDRRVAGAVGGR
ncbi:MAG: VCBS repeat-containing protein [Elusimicrobia bacterium]|nr:VCBS repeat-containing protein [Elusimicrobiota bacterium]